MWLHRYAQAPPTAFDRVGLRRHRRRILYSESHPDQGLQIGHCHVLIVDAAVLILMSGEPSSLSVSISGPLSATTATLWPSRRRQGSSSFDRQVQPARPA